MIYIYELETCRRLLF